MTLTTLTPNLMVEDIGETIEWYERVFDAETTGTLPRRNGGGLRWAQVTIDDVSLRFLRRDSWGYSPLKDAELGGSLTFDIDATGIDGLHDRLQVTEAEVVQELRDTDYGRREFGVRDYNGYVLWFGEMLTR